MCGRFTQRYSWAEVREFLSVFGAPRNLQPRYNIAPTTAVDVVRLDAEGKREIVSMRWGLIPAWWKKPLKTLPATFNARAETAATSPMFGDAVRNRRCIIPASGFFEWTTENRLKVPHYFTAADGSPVLAFAGLWDRWKSPEGEWILSCTILVTSGSDWMRTYHDRMPVILGGGDLDGWLDQSLGPAALRPAAEQALREWVVSSRANKSGQDDDDPGLIEPLTRAV